MLGRADFGCNPAARNAHDIHHGGCGHVLVGPKKTAASLPFNGSEMIDRSLIIFFYRFKNVWVCPPDVSLRSPLSGHRIGHCKLGSTVKVQLNRFNNI
jgi:hypothetical protein